MTCQLEHLLCRRVSWQLGSFVALPHRSIPLTAMSYEPKSLTCSPDVAIAPAVAKRVVNSEVLQDLVIIRGLRPGSFSSVAQTCSISCTALIPKVFPRPKPQHCYSSTLSKPVLTSQLSTDVQRSLCSDLRTAKKECHCTTSTYSF